MAESRKTAVVTGASSGIGAAVVPALVEAGFRVVAGARRLERVRETTARVGAEARALDVTDEGSVKQFLEGLGFVHLLVNNAGLSLGMESVAEARDEDWRTMFETNVLGTLRITRLLLPKLLASGDGHIVNVGSIAGFETYPGGAGYTASKHALRALTRTLRLELVGKPIRVTEVSPGLVDTEFSEVRFRGDANRAKQVYKGMQPLIAKDVAECIAWAATRPAHVNIDEIVVRPRDQATATLVHRATDPSTEDDA